MEGIEGTEVELVERVAMAVVAGLADLALVAKRKGAEDGVARFGTCDIRAH